MAEAVHPGRPLHRTATAVASGGDAASADDRAVARRRSFSSRSKCGP